MKGLHMKKLAFLAGIIMVLVLGACSIDGNSPIASQVSQNTTRELAANGCPTVTLYSFANASDGENVFFNAAVISPVIPNCYYFVNWAIFKDGNYLMGLEGTTYTLFSYSRTMPRSLFSAGKYQIAYFVYNGGGCNPEPPLCYWNWTLSNTITYYGYDATYSALPVNDLNWKPWVYDGKSTQLSGPISSIAVKLSSTNPAIRNVTVSYSVEKSRVWSTPVKNGAPAGSENTNPIQGIKMTLVSGASNMKIKYRVLDSQGNWTEALNGAAAESKDGGSVVAIEVLFLC